MTRRRGESRDDGRLPDARTPFQKNRFAELHRAHDSRRVFLRRRRRKGEPTARDVVISTRNLERFDAEVSVGVDLKRRPVGALRSGSERERGAFLHEKGVKVSIGRARAVENTEKSDRFLGVLRVVRCCLSVPELGNLPGTTKHHRTPGEPPRRDASLRSHAPFQSSVRAKIPSISM